MKIQKKLFSFFPFLRTLIANQIDTDVDIKNKRWKNAKCVISHDGIVSFLSVFLHLSCFRYSILCVIVVLEWTELILYTENVHLIHKWFAGTISFTFSCTLCEMMMNLGKGFFFKAKFSIITSECGKAADHLLSSLFHIHISKKTNKKLKGKLNQKKKRKIKYVNCLYQDHRFRKDYN